MISLRDLQRGMRAALLGESPAAILATVGEDGIGASARLDVYRHHVLSSLTAVLRATFPVVCRLVDERFFGYAADRYIRAAPPTDPCLSEYGATFPEFLGALPACASLPYLADVARLEWAMARALDAPDAAPLDAEALRPCASASAGSLVLKLDPSLSLLASRWPIDAIWRANQSGGDERVVDLRAGGARLEIRRLGDEVVFRALAEGVYALRRSIADGDVLHVAAGLALAADPRLDLARALADLVEEGLITGIVHPPSMEEDHRCHSRQ